MEFPSSVSSLLAIGLLILAVLACSTSNRITPNSGTPVSARALIADYKANEVSADTSYKGRAILITGLVDSIGKDILDTPYVTLNSGERISFPSVQCIGSGEGSEFAGLRKGQEIRVVGICKGKFGNILIQPCTISGSEISADSSPPKPASTPIPSSHEHLVWAKNAIATKDYVEAENQLSHIPKGTAEYEEAQSLTASVKQGLSAQRRDMAPKLREELSRDYQQLVADANPHLNFIQSKITKTKGGFALWATHEFFSQYTLSSGDDARVIQEWISRNRGKLAEAQIVRVGLMGRGGYASWVYFGVATGTPEFRWEFPLLAQVTSAYKFSVKTTLLCLM